MSFDISPAWIKLQEMTQGFLLLLPNLVLALLLFMFFIFAARWIRKLVLRVLDRRGGYLNVGLVIGRLADALSFVRYITAYHYYGFAILEGIWWGGVAVLLSATTVLMTIAILSFNRRDIYA